MLSRLSLCPKYKNWVVQLYSPTWTLLVLDYGYLWFGCSKIRVLPWNLSPPEWVSTIYMILKRIYSICDNSSQLWLHIRIIWGTSKKFWCPSYNADQLNQNLWEKAPIFSIFKISPHNSNVYPHLKPTLGKYCGLFS